MALGPGDDHDPALMEDVEALVRRWLTTAATGPSTPAARRLADMLKDPSGLDFTVGFVDRVVRPEDVRVAARSLRDLARHLPSFLPWHLKATLRIGAVASTVAPRVVVAVARRALRRMVGHLLIDATDAKLGSAIARLQSRGVRLNLNLLGEAVLGEAEARSRLDNTARLLARPDVDYVSIKVSAALAPHSPWSFEETVANAHESLLPVFRTAADAATPKFINLDMEEYADLDLTIAVFTSLLDRPELLALEAGIVLQAYLPDALSAMVRLQDWAAARTARGGARIKVRLVKGANLPMERVEASLHGWPLATWATKRESDTHYKRVLDYALHADRTANVRLGVAGHNLFDIAYAWELAGRRNVRHDIEVEMLLGMAEGQAQAVRQTVGDLLLYVPVVHPEDFDVAIAYLVRRLEEGANPENFMSAVFDLDHDAALYERERSRFLSSLSAVNQHVPTPNRTQDRGSDVPALATDFSNTPDTDPALPANRRWARQIIGRVADSTLGQDLVADHTVTSTESLDSLVRHTAQAARRWGSRPATERAGILRRAAVEFESRRASLLEVMASECGKTLEQGDPEVSEAIDFLSYYAGLAEELDHLDGAVARPVGVTVVASPWNFPVAIPTGSVAGALAAGSGVVLKPAPQARRCGSLVAQALWEAGVPAEVLKVAQIDDGELGRGLVSHPVVDRVILTGAFSTAQLFTSFRPDLQLLAETSGKNAIVVTPSADLDLAVRDLTQSAFGHAGQKCSAASLGILVGSVARSRRFHEQLRDAVSSLRVGLPSDPRTQVGPLIEPARGKLHDALTQLGPGEEWLVRPKQLDGSGLLWSPGVKTGVRRGSVFHLTECFGPVLGLMAADSLADALALQNQVEYGLTGGLHSLDVEEVEQWLEDVEAGNLYVNRGITGAVVRRQPFGGWKRSAVGAGTKAGGPNYLVGLVDWSSAPAAGRATIDGPIRRLLHRAQQAGVSRADLDFLERAAASDAVAWTSEFGIVRDVSGLYAERNYLRYLPIPVCVRVEGEHPAPLLRVIAAGVRAGTRLHISTSGALEPAMVDLILEAGATYAVADDEQWKVYLRRESPPRVRLVGGTRAAFGAATGGRPDIALYAQPVVESGRVELLTFLREQAISLTAHRFGSPTSLADIVEGSIEEPVWSAGESHPR